MVLRRYDDARAQGDEAGARRALVEALGLIQSLTARSPADGNLWALLAAIDSGLNGFGASTEAYLRLSQANAPFEFPALRKRVALRLAALDDLGPPDREALTRDIGVLLSAEPKHREIAFMADAARPRAPVAIAFAREAIVRKAPDWAPAFDQFLRARPDF